MQRPSVYIASPLGFSEVGRYFYEQRIIPEVDAIGYLVLDPWKIPVSEQAFEAALGLPFGVKRRACFREANKIAGAANEQAIRMADLVTAILDGTDVDSGTASAIGFAAGIGKPIIGYRGDFRLSANNIGSTVNLQIEHWITMQGGSVFSTWKETLEVLNARYIGFLSRQKSSVRNPS